MGSRLLGLQRQNHHEAALFDDRLRFGQVLLGVVAAFGVVGRLYQLDQLDGSSLWEDNDMVDAFQPCDEFEAGVLQCTRDSFLNEKPFPLSQAHCTAADVERALQLAYEQLAPIIESPTPEQLAKPVRSPIGDPIDGREGLIRAAQHAAYHTGQIWLMRMHPQFPEANL